MAFLPGARIGVYEITAPIGEGGMGQVYRGTDTTLGRQVAIKVLPDIFAADADRLARFEREAKTLASLNHPHIAAIYGFEKSAGTHALVMELVEGEDLSQRIGRGAMPVDQALPIAKQIVEALQAAHDQGIVHRDLKPANVKVRPDGTVKVLDFGLAKAFEGDPAVLGTSITPTITSPAMTRIGTILGTAAYMSPEQARGRAVDRRTDIWAFGVVLYEMLTGKRPFLGEDVTETVAAVVKEQPDLDELPIAVRKLVKSCLEKDPKRRLQAIGDVWLLLEDAAPAAPPARRSRHSLVAWTVAAAALLAAAGVSLVHFLERPPVPQPVRFRIPAPEDITMVGGESPVLSPDGRRLAYVASAIDGRGRLWVHSLDSLESQPLSRTEDAARPFWSPDSRTIGFSASGKLLKVDASGGPVQRVVDAGVGNAGGARALGAWNSRGVIIFAGTDGLRQIPENGGTSTSLTVLDPTRGESGHASPVFLPDGAHFLYVRASTAAEHNGVYVGSLDAAPEQKGFGRLLAGAVSAAYVPALDGAHGHLLFVRDRTLMALPFDHRRLQPTGPAVPVTGQGDDVGFFSASGNGELAYRPNRAGGTFELTWFDRGKSLGPTLQPGLLDIAISPDGTRVAGSTSDLALSVRLGRAGSGRRIGPSRVGSDDLWIGEFDRGIRTPFTSEASAEGMPVWSPDSKWIIFASNRDGPLSLYRKASNGGSDAELLFKSDDDKWPNDWSRDGFLLYSSSDSKGGTKLWVLPLKGDGTPSGQPFSYSTTNANEGDGRFSPDGRWVAYESNETGRNEIYVRGFRGPSGVTTISNGGGREPRWRRDGRELFYLGPRGQVIAVDVTTDPAFRVVGAARQLFEAPIYGGPTRRGSFDVAADGRFLITTGPGAKSDPGTITIVLNWQSTLKR